jgi:hypothetical protein
LIFEGFKASTNTLILKISIFSDVPASFSAQKYLFKILKIAIPKIFGVFKARTNELRMEISIFSRVPVGFSAQKYLIKILKVLHSQIGRSGREEKVSRYRWKKR